MYLIDTNVLILGIAGKDPDATFLQHAIESDTIHLSVITVAEFLSRAETEERRAFEKLLGTFPALTVTEEIAHIAAEYRGASRKSTRVTLLDCLIAAQAKLHNLTLVTNNKRDFPMRDIKVVVPQ